MKRYRLMAFIFAILMGLHAHAETEVYASVGFFPQGRVAGSWYYLFYGDIPHPSDSFDFYPSDLNIYGDNVHINYPEITIGAMHTLFHHFSVGVQYSEFKAKADNLPSANSCIINPIPQELKYKSIVHTDWYIHNVMAVAKYTWLKVRKWSFYSKAGVGIRIKTSKTKLLATELNVNIHPAKNETSCAYEVLPLGIDYRFWGPLSLYAEGGYGTTACLSTGLRATF